MDTNGFQNRHFKEEALWQAAISAGLYPNVSTRRNGEVNFSTMTNRKAKIHVSSVNAVKGQVRTKHAPSCCRLTIFILIEFVIPIATIIIICKYSHSMQSARFPKGKSSLYALEKWSSKMNCRVVPLLLFVF